MLKMWYLTTSKSRVSLDAEFCALLGLLVTKTPRRQQFTREVVLAG